MPENLDRYFSFHCSQCAKKLRVKEKAAGRRLKCPNCGNEVVVPEPPGSLSPSQAEEAASENEQTLRRRPSLFDVDELVLEESPIENLQERKRQAQAIQDARAAERRRRLAADEQRRNPIEKTAEVIQPHSRRSALQAQFRDAYIDLEPENSNTEGDRDADESPEAQRVLSQPAANQARRTVFDEDLPELMDAGTRDVSGNPAKSSSAQAEEDLNKIVAALGKQAIELDLDDLAPGSFKSAGEQANSVAQQDKYEEKYRVTCPTCGTIQYASPAQQRSKITCPDCTSKITVPPPPANWKPSRVKTRHQQFNEETPLAENDELVAIDHQRRLQTQSLLERAEVALSQEEEEGKLLGTDFDTSGFLRRTLGFALDPVAIGVMLGYAVVFALVFSMLQFGLSSDGSAFRQGIMLFCALTAPVLGIIFGMPMISAALALLEAAANQQKRVTDWPSMNIFEHFGDVMAVSVALLSAAIPGYLLGTWLGADIEGSGRIQITGVMLTTFLLFPIFYLSILDGGSLLQLLTRDVLRSTKEVSEAWGGYYLKTMIVFASVMFLWYLLLGSGKSPLLGAIGGAILPGLVFFTFHQLGLLADSIGENLSPLQSPNDSKRQEGDLEDEIESA